MVRDHPLYGTQRCSFCTFGSVPHRKPHDARKQILMNAGVTLLTMTSNYLSYRRFENVYKLVCTEAGKEVARSKKVINNDGMEYTLFLAP